MYKLYFEDLNLEIFLYQPSSYIQHVTVLLVGLELSLISVSINGQLGQERILVPVPQENCSTLGMTIILLVLFYCLRALFTTS